MRKKKSKKPSTANEKTTVFRNFEETPNKYRSKIDPINLEEQKYRFLHEGITPQFEFKTHQCNVSISNSKKGQIRFEYLNDAIRILEKVRMKFGCGDRYMEEAYGEIVECDHASAVVARYMKECGVEGMLTVSGSKDLSCSGRMSWCGPCTKYNKPEARRYSLWIKNSVDNAFLRDKGIKCLADHEIGTHFFRNVNDGLQPWYSDRARFGLRGMKSQTLMETEEGLAAINTLLQANHKLLFFPAITYYTACKATEMSFQELFDHLNIYIRDSNLRWKYVMRMKRGLQDASDVGGYGKDQCYFTGAVEILKNLDKIDFSLLYAGKVCLDELPRVKRLARLDCLKLPQFLHNMEEYRKQLKYIASVNGLSTKSAKKSAKLKSGTRRKLYRQFAAKPTLQSIAVNNAGSFYTGSCETKDVQSDNDESLCNSHKRDSSSGTSKCAAECIRDDIDSLSGYSCCATASQPDSRQHDYTPSVISSVKSHPISEYTGSTHQSSQSGYTYSWQSVRTPSPAMMVHSDEGSNVSPIPYSPSRWLRRRKTNSPNVLPRKQSSRESLANRKIHPTSVVKF